MHLVGNNCLRNQHNLFQSCYCMWFHCWADLYRLILIQGSTDRIFVNSGWILSPGIPVLTRNIQNWTILDQKVDLQRQKKPTMNSKFSYLSKIISIFKCISRLTLSCCILIGLCHLCQPVTKENDPLTIKKWKIIGVFRRANLVRHFSSFGTTIRVRKIRIKKCWPDRVLGPIRTTLIIKDPRTSTSFRPQKVNCFK